MTKAATPWEALVQQLNLQPHPEGGYYREVFRSRNSVQFGQQSRDASTSIYYLLNKGNYSAWHKIDADETWYFLAGQPLLLHQLSETGELISCQLGNALTNKGVVFQTAVPSGRWFAAELAEQSDFALVACSVAPAFEFSTFQIATISDLAAARQRHGGWLDRLLKQP